MDTLYTPARLPTPRWVTRCLASFSSFHLEPFDAFAYQPAVDFELRFATPPRTPMPPRWRSKWVQPLTSRVSRCCICANSACTLPSALLARWAKMSMMRSMRSIARTPVIFHVADLHWRQGMVENDEIDFLCLDRFGHFSTLPLPAKEAGLAYAFWR